MTYRVRAKRGRRRRHVLTLDVLNRLDSWARAEYVALRDELVETFLDRLEIIEPIWQFEPGVPAHLRTLPAQPDPRMVAARGLPEDHAAFELAQTAHNAILAGRRSWLESNPLYDGGAW